MVRNNRTVLACGNKTKTERLQFPLNEQLFRENQIYLNVKSSPIFFITSAEDNLTLLPDFSV